MYSYMNLKESFRVLNSSGGYISNLPRTLRTLLISLYSPYSPSLFEHSNRVNQLKRVKHFEPLGLSPSLKEIDFNALQCVERSRIEPMEPLELLR